MARHDDALLAHSRGPTNPTLHFMAADMSSLPTARFREHLLLATVLRKQVFVEELGLAEPAFELTEADQAWRHVFAQRELGCPSCLVVCSLISSLCFQEATHHLVTFVGACTPALRHASRCTACWTCWLSLLELAGRASRSA